MYSRLRPRRAAREGRGGELNMQGMLGRRLAAARPCGEQMWRLWALSYAAYAVPSCDELPWLRAGSARSGCQ